MCNLSSACLVLLALLSRTTSSVAAVDVPPQSLPPARSVDLGGGSRLSVLTPRVLRLEVGATEDGLSITFPTRDSLDVPRYLFIYLSFPGSDSHYIYSLQYSEL